MLSEQKTDENKMTLFRLGLEYEKHIEIQNQFIADCNEKIKQAKKSGDFKAETELIARRRAFYGIREELTATAKILKNYYKE